jgi:2-oxoglutarate ferredoxin oxidoreductase subunit beta
VFSGDGDCIGIGGNHFMHAARRNIDLTVILLDNNIYGMTGGQVSPSTPMQATTQTSPHGNPDPPIDASAVAIACGATYVARWTSAHPVGIKKAVKEAISHKGFSLVHTLSQCPTQAGRYIYGTPRADDLLEYFKDRTVTRKKARKLSADELSERIVIGRLHQSDQRPELSKSIAALRTSVKG